MAETASRRKERTKPKPPDRKDDFLADLGNQTRRLRARRGLTRKELAREAQVSERHLANLEMGVGNPSVQILRHIASALDCSAAELIDCEVQSPDLLLIRDLLRGRSERTYVAGASPGRFPAHDGQ